MNALYKLYCRCFQRVMYVAEYFLPWRVPEQISGEGSLAKLPAFAKAKGFKSALLVTDQGLMSLGMAQPIIDGFKAEGLNIAVYDKVVPNPTITNIEEGLKLYKDNNCDVIIAQSMGEPPPSAMMQSGSKAAICLAPSFAQARDGSGATSEKVV